MSAHLLESSITRVWIGSSVQLRPRTPERFTEALDPIAHTNPSPVSTTLKPDPPAPTIVEKFDPEIDRGSSSPTTTLIMSRQQRTHRSARTQLVLSDLAVITYENNIESWMAGRSRMVGTSWMAGTSCMLEMLMGERADSTTVSIVKE